jgi:ubiquitin C-terminal hydrolase
MTDRGAVGIINMGNTCFAAAVFQAIRAIPELSAYILKNDLEKECTQDSRIITAYKDLIQVMFKGSLGDKCRPAGFYEIMRNVVKGTIYEQFSQRLPNDAHEFTVYLLDQFHIAMKRPIVLKENQSVEQFSPSQKAWYNEFKTSYSPLADLLFGLEKVTCTCKNCNNVSTRWEVFNMLKVGFEGPPDTYSVEKMLYNEINHIENIDDYQCDNCKTRSSVEIRRAIWKLPHVLIIVIRRFTPLGHKENKAVDITPEFNAHTIFDKDSNEPSRNFNYTLLSTINHHGNHFGGHYTASAINPVNSKWYFYDDDAVEEMVEPPSKSSNVYLMVYRR